MRSASAVRRRGLVVGLAIAVITVVALVAWPYESKLISSTVDTTTSSMSRAPTDRDPMVRQKPEVLLPRADQTTLVRGRRITGDLSPKSVVASLTGLVTAQNMMYRHTVSVFTPDGKLKGTVNDSVDLSQFGIDGHPGTSRGSPVEAAFTHDGKHLYVSNYAMYGESFGPEGLDSCTPETAPDKSYLYRVDTKTLKIDQVIPVGAVPKYVAVTPDDSTVLVTNWCSWTMSVVDVASGKLIKTIPIPGSWPRGIAVSLDSRSAYVAVMGSQRIAKVDLASSKVSTFAKTGNGPRHIVISPDGRYLYVTNNSSGTVSKLDATDGTMLATVATGRAPRSMAISSDGHAVYVVNYDSSTVTKLRTSDLRHISTTTTEEHPIGIAYEPTTRSVWVASYSGSIVVYDDSKVASS